MRPRIVIADDDILIRYTMLKLLEEHGYEVVGEASDGAEAVNVVQQSQPDVVLLDISMPVNDRIRGS